MRCVVVQHTSVELYFGSSRDGSIAAGSHKNSQALLMPVKVVFEKLAPQVQSATAALGLTVLILIHGCLVLGGDASLVKVSKHPVGLSEEQ